LVEPELEECRRKYEAVLSGAGSIVSKFDRLILSA
jgi:hypothetical protein